MPEAAGGATATVLEREFYQYRQPFELPDEVTTPEGKTFSGHRARVYWLLRLTLERRHQHPVGRQLGPAGWVPVFLFREPWSGGQSGGRRVRELREYGVEVEIEEYRPPTGDSSATTLYRLSLDPISGLGAGRGPSRVVSSALRSAHGGEVAPPAHRGGSARPPSPPRGSAGTPRRTAAPRPLAGFRFRFAVGESPPRRIEADQRAIDLTPGSREPLAPPLGLSTAEAYDDHLVALFERGVLVDNLRGGGRRRLLFHLLPLQRPPFDLEAVLTRALEACGAVLEVG